MLKYVFGALLLSIFFGVTEVNANDISIDEMRSLDKWYSVGDGMSVSIVNDGLKITYDFKKPNSYVYIYKDIPLQSFIDDAKASKMDKIKFNYTGSGHKNTIELQLAYNDDKSPNSHPGHDDNTTFISKRNNKTEDNVEIASLNMNYLKGGKYGKYEKPVLEFGRVERVRFTISNDPTYSDEIGNGYVIIKSLSAEMTPKGPNFIINFIEKNQTILAAIITLIGGLILGRKSCRY